MSAALRYILVVALLAVFLPLTSPAITFAPVRLKVSCDGESKPLGTDAHPRFSWKILSDRHGEFQTASQIQVATTAASLARGEADMWDSGKVVSPDSILLGYGGKPLQSHHWYYWRARVWDGDGVASDWSDIHSFATGIIEQREWSGKWLAAAPDQRGSNQPSCWFRKDIVLESGDITSALCSVASAGYHELYVNGVKIGADVMAPAISDLSKRALYITRDIAPQLHKGTNTIAIWLAQGWAGHTGKYWYSGSDLHWVDEPAFILQGNIRGRDYLLSFVSDTDWKCHRANTESDYPPRHKNLGGELQDDGTWLPDWNKVAFDISSWPNAVEKNISLSISPQLCECNRLYQDFHPVTIREKADGTFQADMGRHFSGWIEVQAEGAAGGRIEISMSERENEAASYSQQNLLILGPSGKGVFKNHFKHQSGRWITIKGLKSPPTPDKIIGHAITTGFERTGQFSCSSRFYNRLYETALWTFQQISLGGYVVDCPHRERMGYGDSINAVPAALLGFDADNFFTKWSRDWIDVQQPDSNVPFTAPTYNGGGGPMWSDTLVHLPYLTWQYTGDRAPIEQCYPAILRWMDYQQKHTSNHILEWFPGPTNIVQTEWSFLGDWVYPGHQQAPNGRDRDSLFMNNCYHLHTLNAVAQIAQALGHPDDANHFRAEAAATATAVQNEFWDPQTQSYPGDRQTFPAAALFAGLPPDNLRPVVAHQLEERILKKRQLDTGILGTYFLVEALTAENRSDLMDIIASRQDPPGWGGMLSQGATTIWEQWDGVNSRCHSSFLSIGSWFIEGILGIRPDPKAPGFRHFHVHPGLADKLNYASGSCETGYGRIAVSWKHQGSTLLLNVSAPPGTTATVFVPGARASLDVSRSGGISAKSCATLSQSTTNSAVFQISSGSYVFQSHFPVKKDSDKKQP